MTCSLVILLLAAATAPPTLDSIRKDPNPEHRAKAAVEFAVTAERAVESAYDKGAERDLADSIRDLLAAIELARDSFTAAGKTPYRSPSTFKGPQLRTHDILHRLGDLRQRMGADERPILDGPIMKIQEIHDAWLEGIMGKKP